MTSKEKLTIRLEERLKIYRDSPGTQVTYVDLAHIADILLEMLVINKEPIGFKTEGGK